MQNQTSSTPILRSTATATGMMISTMEIRSSTKPAMKAMNSRMKMVAVAERFAAASSPSTALIPPSATNTPANMVPPSRMVRIMAVTWSVFMNAACRVATLNRPYTTVRMTVPMAPIAAASVGVAQPSMIVPSTEKMSTSGGIMAVAVM